MITEGQDFVCSNSEGIFLPDLHSSNTDFFKKWDSLHIRLNRSEQMLQGMELKAQEKQAQKD